MLFKIARANPRTTLAGIVGGASLLGGMFATYHTERMWPIVVGIVAKVIADAYGHASAQDGTATPQPPPARLQWASEPDPREAIPPQRPSGLARAAALCLVALLCLLPGRSLASIVLTGVPASNVVGSYTAPSAGDMITGNSIQVPVQGLANDVATLAAGGNLGSPIALGDASVVIGPGAVTKALTLYVIPPTILTATRTLSLQTTTLPVPKQGQRIRLFIPADAGHTLSANMVVKREGSGATLGTVLGGFGELGFLEFEYLAVPGWILVGAHVGATWSVGGDSAPYGY
jgi:hypothetical protein